MKKLIRKLIIVATVVTLAVSLSVPAHASIVKGTYTIYGADSRFITAHLVTLAPDTAVWSTSLSYGSEYDQQIGFNWCNVSTKNATSQLCGTTVVPYPFFKNDKGVVSWSRST
jgi:uncharacterized membrane protein YciS (DUF1049 family)